MPTTPWQGERQDGPVTLVLSCLRPIYGKCNVRLKSNTFHACSLLFYQVLLNTSKKRLPGLFRICSRTYFRNNGQRELKRGPPIRVLVRPDLAPVRLDDGCFGSNNHVPSFCFPGRCRSWSKVHALDLGPIVPPPCGCYLFRVITAIHTYALAESMSIRF